MSDINGGVPAGAPAPIVNISGGSLLNGDAPVPDAGLGGSIPTPVEAVTLTLPQDGDEKAWGEFYTRLGRPEAADKYELTAPEGVDTGLINPEKSDGFRKMAFDLGLNAKQAQGLYQGYLGIEAAQAAAATQAETQNKEAGRADLAKEWGANYAQNINAAAQAAKALGGDALLQELDRTGAANSPVIIKALHSLAQRMGGSSLVAGETTAGMLSPQAAKAEIDKVMAGVADPKNPYFNPSHPQHNETVKRMAELHRIALM